MAEQPDQSDSQGRNLESARIPRRPVPMSPKYINHLDENDKVVVPFEKAPSQFSDRDTVSQGGSEPRTHPLYDQSISERQMTPVNEHAETEQRRDHVYDNMESEPQKNEGYSEIEAKPDKYQRRRNPWGLGPWAWAVLVALTTAIIVGAIVGGAVSTVRHSGSGTSSGSGSSATGTAASTASPTGPVVNYTPVPARQVQSLANNCSSINGQAITSNQGKGPIFRVECPLAIDGSYGNNSITLGALIAYTFNDCLDACVGMNNWKSYNICTSVTWASNMAEIVNFSGSNCWLFRNGSASHVANNYLSGFLT